MKKVDRKSSILLSDQIKNDLVYRIGKGEIQAGEKISSEAKLAQEYDVSLMTARQAVVELICNGMLKRVPGKGTFVLPQQNETAPMTSQRKRQVAIVVFSAEHDFFARIMHGAVKKLAKNDMDSVLFLKDGHPLQERQLISQIMEGDFCGLILISDDDTQDNADLLNELSNKIPIVIVDDDVANVNADKVLCERQSGAYLMTEHLISLGHKRIILLAGNSEDESSTKERIAGYKQALEKHGIEYDPDLVHFKFWHPQEGYNGVKQYLISCGSAQRPTAIFACNDNAAVGLANVVYDLGLSIPEDIAVVGYGNTDIAMLTRSPLTTVDQRPSKMGLLAAEMLQDRLEGRLVAGEFKTIVVPTRVVARESCGIKLAVSVA